MTAVVHVLEWKVLAFRRLWRSTLSTSLLNPVLLLSAFGLGVGSLIEPGDEAAFGPGGYLAFVGTAVLATTAMSVTSVECCWGVLAGFVRQRSFLTMASTPLRPVDIVTGVAAFVALRALLAAGGVAVVLLAIPVTRSLGLVPAVGAAALSGLASGLPLAAFAATRRGDDAFPAIQRFVVLPLLLFGGALFPVDGLPAAVRAVIVVLPPWNGIELCRAAVLGTPTALPAAVHVLYLGGWVVVGLIVCVRAFAHRLARS